MTDKIHKIKDWISKEQDQRELVEESIDYNKLNTMLDDSLEKETPESWNEMLKEDTPHRTKADVDAAMADVEGKAKAFTEAHKGETSEEILAQMRGEQKPISKMKTPEESLGIDSYTYNKIVDECIYGEQKPTDKVEPKFKEGDWVVIND